MEDEEEWMTTVKDMVSMMKLSDEFRHSLLKSMLIGEKFSYTKKFDDSLRSEIQMVCEILKRKIDNIDNKIKALREKMLLTIETSCDGVRRGIENLTQKKRGFERKQRKLEAQNRERLFRFLNRPLQNLLKDTPKVWRNRFLKHLEDNKDHKAGEHVRGDAFEDLVFKSIQDRLRDVDHLEVYQNVYIVSPDEILEGDKAELDVIIIDKNTYEVVTLIEVKRSFVSLPSGLKNVPKICRSTKFVLSELKGRVELRSSKRNAKAKYSFSPDLYVIGVGFLIDEDTCDTTIQNHLEASLVSHIISKNEIFERATFDETKGIVSISCPKDDDDTFSFGKYYKNCWIFCDKEDLACDKDEEEDKKNDEKPINNTKTLVNDALSKAGFAKRPILIPIDLMQNISIESFVSYALNSLASRRKMFELLRSATFT